MSRKTFKSHGVIINALEHATTPANIDKISKGKRIYELNTLKEKKVFFVIEGDYLIRSKVNNKIIGIASAPFIIGVTPAHIPLQVYIESIDYGIIRSIEYTQFWSLASHNHLTEHVLGIISDYHVELITRLQLYHNNIENQIKTLILQWAECPGRVREKLPLIFFVINSLPVSKSTVCRVLKKMKQAGCIEMNNGKLISCRSLDAVA